MIKRKGIIGILVLILLLFTGQTALANTDFDVSADSAVIMEASTGQMLFQKNADSPIPPASITKLMTLIVAFEALESGEVDWDDKVTISEEAWSMGGSQMFLEIGQEVTFGDLITGISVVSANDACVAVAEHLYGSEAAFTNVMNQRATELGLTNSRFQNSTGLPAPGHEMSARDIATMAQYLITTFPKILELESMQEFTYNDIRQYNRNPLLGRYPGADGLKTGWTSEAGYCLVGTAEQNEKRLISVVLNTASDQARLTASRELLDHGFYNFQLRDIVQANQIMGEVAIADGRQHVLPISVQDQISMFIPTGREGDLEFVVLESEALKAPVTAGTPITTLDIKLDGEVLSSIELVAAEDMKRANIFVRMFRAIGSFFSNLF
ncbi:D-alanyl-D-alanine carboxypeptidase (penicillin-binding protein 5/6) [Desulfitispora alkaliphila]|uniref:D-alanyl-D-alanine carboxypeptidase family protein n=1 Tax=Desulfitispora alkaliphila TaxID=622674 RepID=UPI003D199E51